MIMTNMLKKPLLISTILAAAFSVFGGGLKYENGDAYLKLGGRVQFQYHQTSPDGGESTDELLFRRLRPYIEGSVNKDWMGKCKVDNKDAYFAYKGIDGMQIAFGNANFPFSREFLTSSKYQQMVERSF